MIPNISTKLTTSIVEKIANFRYIPSDFQGTLSAISFVIDSYNFCLFLLFSHKLPLIEIFTQFYGIKISNKIHGNQMSPFSLLCIIKQRLVVILELFNRRRRCCCLVPPSVSSQSVAIGKARVPDGRSLALELLECVS